MRTSNQIVDNMGRCSLLYMSAGGYRLCPCKHLQLTRLHSCRPIAAPKPLLGVVKVKPVAVVKSIAAARQARPAPAAEQPAKKQKVEARAATAAASKAEDSDVGLPGLIGAYGSDSDDESAGQDGAADASAAGALAGSTEARSATRTDSGMPSEQSAAAIDAASDQGAEELDYET